MVPALLCLDRLVEFDKLKRSILKLYSQYLMKGHFPFCYISIKIDGSLIDINYHPSKNQVLLVNEEAIISRIVNSIENEIECSSTTKAISFKTIQFPEVKSPSISSTLSVSDFAFSSPPPAEAAPHNFEHAATPRTTNTQSITPSKRQYSDPRVRTLDFFKYKFESKEDAALISNRTEACSASVKDLAASLQQACVNMADKNLTDILNKHIFIGMYDHATAIIQYETALLSIDFQKILFQFLYQKSIESIIMGNVSSYIIPAPIKFSKVDSEILDVMKNVGFGIDADNDVLLSFPAASDINFLSLLKFEQLSFASFVEKLHSTINAYSNDKFLVHHIISGVCEFYTDASRGLVSQNDILRNVIFERIRNPPYGYSLDAGVRRVTTLETLYKIFERC